MDFYVAAAAAALWMASVHLLPVSRPSARTVYASGSMEACGSGPSPVPGDLACT